MSHGALEPLLPVVDSRATRVARAAVRYIALMWTIQVSSVRMNAVDVSSGYIALMWTGALRHPISPSSTPCRRGWFVGDAMVTDS